MEMSQLKRGVSMVLALLIFADYRTNQVDALKCNVCVNSVNNVNTTCQESAVITFNCASTETHCIAAKPPTKQSFKTALDNAINKATTIGEENGNTECTDILNELSTGMATYLTDTVNGNAYGCASADMCTSFNLTERIKPACPADEFSEVLKIMSDLDTAISVYCCNTDLCNRFSPANNNAQTGALKCYACTNGPANENATCKQSDAISITCPAVATKCIAAKPPSKQTAKASLDKAISQATAIGNTINNTTCSLALQGLANATTEYLPNVATTGNAYGCATSEMCTGFKLSTTVQIYCPPQHYSNLLKAIADIDASLAVFCCDTNLCNRYSAAPHLGAEPFATIFLMLASFTILRRQ